jgi:LL-diaminopimelate aminotransferase
VDTSVMTGQTGLYNSETQQFDNITYLKCSPENDFFPDLESSAQADVVFFCSPNNPTGAAASRAQLTELVAWAKKRGSLIVFDAAYSVYISDPDVPKSIFEIPGAEEVRVLFPCVCACAYLWGSRHGQRFLPKLQTLTCSLG